MASQASPHPHCVSVRASPTRDCPLLKMTAHLLRTLDMQSAGTVVVTFKMASVEVAISCEKGTLQIWYAEMRRGKRAC